MSYGHVYKIGIADIEKDSYRHISNQDEILDNYLKEVEEESNYMEDVDMSGVLYKNNIGLYKIKKEDILKLRKIINDGRLSEKYIKKLQWFEYWMVASYMANPEYAYIKVSKVW